MKDRYKPKFRREDLLTAHGLVGALQRLFPELPAFPHEDLIAEIATNEANHHSVLADFWGAFREEAADDIQISGLAKLIETSLSVRDNLENAWMTCFLEHRPRRGPLWSQLSPQIKAYIRTN